VPASVGTEAPRGGRAGAWGIINEYGLVDVVDRLA
jgi:hypothetical protein